MLPLRTASHPQPHSSFPLRSEAAFSPPRPPWSSEGSEGSEGSDPARESDEDYPESFLSNPSRRKRVREFSGTKESPPKKRFGILASEKNAEYPYNTHPSTSPSHAAHCDENLHVDLSNGCSSFPITQCPILRKLRMHFGPHGFVCEKCGQLYPPKYLDAHIRSKNHANDLGIPSSRNQRQKVYRVIVSHLLASHGVREDTVFSLPETIPDTIPGLTPILCYKCPACTTPRWLQWKSLGVHYLKEHKPARRPDKQMMNTRYIIRPYRVGSREGAGGRSDLNNTVIMLPEEWTPKEKHVTGLDSIATGSNEVTNKIRAKRKRQSGEAGEPSSCDVLESLVEQDSGKKLIINRDFSEGFPSIKINLLRSDQKEHFTLVPSDSLESTFPKPIPIPIPMPSTLLLDQVEPDSGDYFQSDPSDLGETNPPLVSHQRAAEQSDAENAQTGGKYSPLPPSGSGAGKRAIAIQAGDRHQPKHPRMVGRTAAPNLACIIAKVEQIMYLQHEISIDSDAMLRVSKELITGLEKYMV